MKQMRKRRMTSGHLLVWLRQDQDAWENKVTGQI